MYWYLGDALGLFVLLPALVLFLHRLVKPLAQVNRHLLEIRETVVAIALSLDSIPSLGEAQMLTGSGLPGVVRYAEAVQAALTPTLQVSDAVHEAARHG